MRLAFICLTAVPLFGSDLIRNGTSNYSICVSPQASPSERHAAGELQNFLHQISGARLDIAYDCANAPAKSILIGEGPATRALGFTAPGGSEEYRIQTSGQRLIIAGGRLRGTLYGVYAFLDKLGCRWFTAGVSRIPRLQTIALPVRSETGKPAFEYREPFFTEAWDRDWAARNRTNGDHSKLDASVGGKVQYYPFVHSFNQLVPPEKYFAGHPEYFSLIGGARRAERSQLCLTNPDVFQLVVQRVQEWIKTHPEATIFSVSQNDWEGWCECDRCLRVEQEEGGVHSGPLLRFVNAVAAEIGKGHPDKLIDTLAYWYTEAPPAHVKPAPNVRIRLCPIGICIAHPMGECPRSAYFVRNLKAWARITNQLYIWHYNTNFSHYLAPVPDFDELRADIGAYRKTGVVGLFLQGAYPPGGGGENSELRAYVTARLLWNPEIDVDREIDDFLEAVYGKAAPQMRRYFELLHGEVRMPPAGLGQHIWIFNLPAFSPSFREKAETLFREAQAAAGDPAVQRRLEQAHLPLEYMDLASAREYRIEDGWYTPPNLPALRSAWKAFLAKLPSFGITSIHEGRQLDWDHAWVDAMKPLKAVTLDAAGLRAVVVPELSGRIVQLVQKSTGRDLLRRPDPGDRGYPAAGGVLVEAASDFVARPWTGAWTLVSASDREVVQQADFENGLRITETIFGARGGIVVRITAENRAANLLQTAIRTTANLDPGNPDDLTVRFRSRAGDVVTQSTVRAGEPPDGSAVFDGERLPDGRWEIAGASGVSASMTFDQDRTGRAVAGWNAKGVPRAALALWTQPLRLAPQAVVSYESNIQPR